MTLLFLAHAAMAADLCDQPCSATLGFSNGGSISAPAGATISFSSGGVLSLGDGGNLVLGDGGSSTPATVAGDAPDFSNGGTLVLGSGGAINFGSNGQLVTGDAGQISVPGSGAFNVTSAETVTITSAGAVHLGNLSGGALDLTTGTSLTSPDTSTPINFDATDPAASFNATAQGPLTADNLGDFTSIYLAAQGSVTIGDLDTSTSSSSGGNGTSGNLTCSPPASGSEISISGTSISNLQIPSSCSVTIADPTGVITTGGISLTQQPPVDGGAFDPALCLAAAIGFAMRRGRFGRIPRIP